MTIPVRAGDAPIGIDVVEGKSYYWCTCGKSLKQPFCDGSHKGTEFSPLVYKSEQSKKYGPLRMPPPSAYLKD